MMTINLYQAQRADGKTLKTKIYRELARLSRQASDLFRTKYIAGKFRRVIYDYKKEEKLKITNGTVILSGDVGVILIYQSGRVLESTKNLIKWMLENNIAPVVVANGGIRYEEDRSYIASICAMIIERPNLGYDFGGYRDGILRVINSTSEVNRLYVVNDSIWLPIFGGSNVLDESRKNESDIWGIFEDIDRSNKKVHGIAKFHVQSYFFRFSEKIVHSREFLNFWWSMPIINDRRSVIRHLETKLTLHFDKLGFTHSALMHPDDIFNYIEKINDDTYMRKLLDHQFLVSSGEEHRIIQRLLDIDEDEKFMNEVHKCLLDMKIFTSPFHLHPELMKNIGVPFLKKGGTDFLKHQRQEIMKSTVFNDISDDIRMEIINWDR